MDEERTLHDCCDCVGCICEEYCKAEDERMGSGLMEED